MLGLTKIAGHSLMFWMASLTVAFSTHAQTMLPKPTATKPTAFVGPTSLSASSVTASQVRLVWLPVAGAGGYRITRIENTGDPEATIAELPVSSFATPRVSCAVGVTYPDCFFVDVSKVSVSRQPITTELANATLVEGTIYPHTVTSGKLYTYRVWALFANGVVSPPSPPATVRVQ